MSFDALDAARKFFSANYEIHSMAADLSLPLGCDSAKRPNEQVLVYRELAPAPFAYRLASQAVTARGIMKYRLKGIRLLVLNG